MTRVHKKENVGSRPYRGYTEKNKNDATEVVKQGKFFLKKCSKSVPFNTIRNEMANKHCGKVGKLTIFTNIEE